MPTVEELREKYGDKIADEFAEALEPEWYRKDIAEVGAKAKRADDLERELAKRDREKHLPQTLRELNVDYDSQPLAIRKYLDSYDGDVTDKEALAAYVTEGGISQSQPAQPNEQNPAAAIAEMSAQPTGGQTGVTREELFANAGSPEEVARLAAANPPT